MDHIHIATLQPFNAEILLFTSQPTIMVLVFSFSAPISNPSVKGTFVGTTSQKPSLRSVNVKRSTPKAALHLFEDVNFKGPVKNVTDDTPKFTDFNDKTSSIKIDEGEQWILYSDSDFQGQGIILRPGQYNTMSPVGMSNDVLSSARRVAPSDRQAIMLFRDTNWRGSARTFTGPVANLVNQNFNDICSSMIMLGSGWELFEDVNFKGESKRFDAGAVSSVVPFGLNDKFSSLRPI